MRTGRQYLASLDDGRTIYVDGERVPNVATHPAFAGVASTMAGLYDLAADPANGMTYLEPATGTTANLIYKIPRSIEDLRARRMASLTWARATNGMLGRGPVKTWTDEDGYGTFLAMDPRTGEKKWEFKMNDVTDSGLLTTATDLLFGGGREGYFYALDARDGKVLWKTSLGGMIAKLRWQIGPAIKAHIKRMTTQIEKEDRIPASVEENAKGVS